VAVEADATVTFARARLGHYLAPGARHAGRLVVTDIGLDGRWLDGADDGAVANVPDLWRGAWPAPDPDGHKYGRGHALVTSGGALRTGAARLASRAALRAGAGLVTLACPADAAPTAAASVAAIMVEAFDGVAAFRASLADRRRNALLLGPALGTGPAEAALVETALDAGDRALALDADALAPFAGRAEALRERIAGRAAPVVVTPHEGEFARLFTGRPEVTGAAPKHLRARAAALATGATVLLKGPDTCVAAPDGRVSILRGAPASLATAGSGDTLAGLVVGLLAQGVPAFEAASAAAWLHAACARAFGPGLIAEDLAERLPAVLRALGRD
ncbi:MAG: NAD(P)H-hydrate dehydratase, partial [Hyphomicrobiales bacterium]|nr:NAD(P)H-hydrate dehydratase [Hyphomicrobiales bacterium]